MTACRQYMPSFSPGRWWRRDARHAEVDRGDPGEPAGLVSFLAEERQGEVDAFDFTEPALGFGSGPAGQKVDFDLIKAGQHLRVDVEHGTPEACVRCSLLRPDPAQRGRLEEIRDNLIARIAEAEREGWLGEVEGLKVSLAGAEEKLRQLDRGHGQHAAVDLGIPTTRGDR